MSMGYGGYMHLIQADDEILLYSYCCYDINNADWKENQKKEDGEIQIQRNFLVEPEIHKKLKKMPGGKKKLIEKRVRRDVPYGELFAEKKITVKNAGGTWSTYSDGIDMMAYKLLRKLFDEYQDTGAIPEKVSLFS